MQDSTSPAAPASAATCPTCGTACTVTRKSVTLAPEGSDVAVYLVDAYEVVFTPLPAPADPLTALERAAIDFIQNVYSPLWSEMIQTRGSSPKVRQIFLDGIKPLRTVAWQHIKARAEAGAGT